MHRSRMMRKRNRDLELRLGPSFSSKGGILVSNCARSFPDPITIRDDDDEVQISSPRTFAEKKLGQASSSSHCVKEVKFTCSICMDTMKKEMSTVCSHIFCKACITNAIHVQKKCPTCRRKVSSSNIHHIYLSGATS